MATRQFLVAQELVTSRKAMQRAALFSLKTFPAGERYEDTVGNSAALRTKLARYSSSSRNWRPIPLGLNAVSHARSAEPLILIPKPLQTLLISTSEHHSIGLAGPWIELGTERGSLPQVLSHYPSS